MTVRPASSRVAGAKGGCFQCHGGAAHWHGRNALALAARHYDRTRHRTWAEVVTRTEYGSGRSSAAQQGSLL